MHFQARIFSPVIRKINGRKAAEKKKYIPYKRNVRKGLSNYSTNQTLLMKKLYFLLLSFLLLTRFAVLGQNDLCTGAININCGQTINSTTVGATLDAVATCVTVLNTAPGIWYSFTGDGQITTLSLCGSAFDTKMGVFSGTCAALTCVTGNDDFCGLQSQVSFTSVLGTNYFVLVTGFATNAGTFTLARTCIPAIPPANDLCTGAINIACAQTITGSTSAATLDAVVTCGGTALNTAPGVWYSFTGDGQIATLSLCGSGYDTKIGVFSGTCTALVCVAGNDDFCGIQSQTSFPSVLGTQYFVLVTGFATNSGSFTLTRTCASATPNDDCSGAISINCGQTITGSTATATLDAVSTCVIGLNTAPGLWYKFTGDGSSVTLSLCGSGYDTKIGVFSGPCASLTCVTGNDDFCGLQSQVTFPSVFGTQYYVLVTGFGTNSGSFTLVRTCAFSNELCSGAIDINCGQTISGTTTGAANDAVATCGTSLSTAPGLWYKFTGDGTPVTISTCGGITNYDSKIGIFRGTCASLVCVAGNDDFCGAQSQVSFATSFGTQYYILVTGFSSSTGNFSLIRTCVAPCAGAPAPGTISGPASVCAGSIGTLTLTGFTSLPNISVQWKSSTVPGGPYTGILGATGSTYSFTATGTTTYYIATVTCTTGGQSANSPQFTSVQVAPVHSAVSFTVTTACSPGTVTLTGTASNGGPGNYTHALTGPGTITQNASTGLNNSTGNFTVTNLLFGTHTFTLTSTSGLGCPVASTISGVIIKQTPIITIAPVAGATICNGQVQPINASVVPPSLQTFSQAATILVPAGSPTISAGIGDPYPSLINIAGLPATGVTVKSVKLGNVNHTFPDDMDIVLVSPTGQAVILMSDAGGGTDEIGLDYTFDDSAPTLMADATFNPQGTYKPTNFGTPDIFPAPGPGTLTQATPTLASFSGNPNGDWKLYVVDGFTGDFGFIGNWSITFALLSEVTFSPITNLFTDAPATIAYTGTPSSLVFAKPTTTTLYTASATVVGCTNTATVNIAVNQLPAITDQPTPAAQTICPGFNITYSVTATGPGLTYQWKLGAVNLVNNVQLSGATTNTLTIANVTAANAGSYICVVSGICAPAVISTAAVLTVATAPVMSTQPASVTICTGANASFMSAATGVPAPTIYQWQVSTDAGVTWTNLLTGGSFTPTFSITGATVALNNSRYRVLVTNNCGQSVTSGAATLTVNPLPTVTATALSSRICISDTLVGLSGSPVGGSWSGIGVSGFNFVPSATAVGTYSLAYSYTSALACSASATVDAKVVDCLERLRLLQDNAVKLYPNPNRGRFNIRINSTLYNYLGMKVYNAQGQLVNGKVVNEILVSPVYSGLIFGRVIPIDLTYLPAGIYVIKFYYDDGGRTSEKGFKVVIGAH